MPRCLCCPRLKMSIITFVFHYKQGYAFRRDYANTGKVIRMDIATSCSDHLITLFCFKPGIIYHNFLDKLNVIHSVSHFKKQAFSSKYLSLFEMFLLILSLQMNQLVLRGIIYDLKLKLPSFWIFREIFYSEILILSGFYSYKSLPN